MQELKKAYFNTAHSLENVNSKLRDIRTRINDLLGTLGQADTVLTEENELLISTLQHEELQLVALERDLTNMLKSQRFSLLSALIAQRPSEPSTTTLASSTSSLPVSRVYPVTHPETEPTTQVGLKSSRSMNLSSCVQLVDTSELWERKNRSSSVGGLKKSSRARRLTDSGLTTREFADEELEGKGVVSGFLLPAATEYRIGAYETGSWSIGFGELSELNFHKSDKHANGFCKHAKCRGRDVWVKVFTYEQVKDIFENTGTSPYQLLKEEAVVVCSRYSPYHTQEIGICTDDGCLIFVREYCSRGSLSEILRLTYNEKLEHVPVFKLSFWRKMNIAQNVAHAAKWGIEKQCTHLNLSLNNVLLTENWEVKLADQSYGKFKSILTGSDLDIVGEASLIFQFGQFLYSLLTEKSSNTITNSADIILPPQIPPGLRDLVLHCCNPEPALRPTFHHILSNNTFDNIFFQADSACLDTYIKMWAILAAGRHFVPWEEFVPTFCRTLNIPYQSDTAKTLEFRCLQAFLGGTVDSFDRLMKCIGPFIDGHEVVEQVKLLLSAPWFMGPLSAQDADKLIEPLPGKPFLVRFSSSNGEYSITFKAKNLVLHSRVPKNAKFNLHQYIELVVLKKKFTEAPLSPYQHLFTPKEENTPSCYTFVR